MLFNVYSVRDVCNGFGSPICDHNDATAARSFNDAITRDGVYRPTDYDLYRIGEFDTNTGRVTCLDYPELVARGSDAIRLRDKSHDEVNADG